MSDTPEREGEVRRQRRENALNWSPDFRAELRRSWRTNWLRALFEFASPSLQRLAWIEGDRGWASSFDECYCRYFNDLALDEEHAYVDRRDEGLLSDAEIRLVARFHATADSYATPSGDQLVILADPKWSVVVNEARAALRAVRDQLSDPSELAQLASLEAKWGSLEASREAPPN